MVLQASADVKSSYNMMNKVTPKVKNIRGITVQELNLEPLCRDVKFLPFQFSLILYMGV